MVFIFNPVWVVKTRLALQGAEHHIQGKKYRGLTGIIMEFMILLILQLCRHAIAHTCRACYPLVANTHYNISYPDLIDALHTIYLEEGIYGLYKGLIPALLLTSHGAIQLTIYEKLKQKAERYRAVQQKSSAQPAWLSLVLGGMSKIIASILTYPYQVIKSRLQQREGGLRTSIRYGGTWDCMQKIWR